MFRFKNNKQQSGFSMIEVLVSLIVIGVGMLGLSGLQIATLKTVNNANMHTAASRLIMELGDKMRANPLGVEGGFYDSNVNCTSNEPQCRNNRFCNPQETARFDVQEVMCGIRRAGMRTGGVQNQLLAGTLEIECDPDCTQPNAAHNVTISWNTSKVHNDLQDSSQNQSITVPIIP